MSARKTPPDHELKRLYEDEGLTCQQIADTCGATKAVVARALHKAGINVRDQKGVNHSQWKGGRVVISSGYVGVWRPDHPRCNQQGYVREHIVVMEEQLGRPLTDEEIVHHIDFDKKNNDPKNLFNCEDNKEHSVVHNQANELFGQMVKSGLVIFNRETKEYELSPKLQSI